MLKPRVCCAGAHAAQRIKRSDCGPLDACWQPGAGVKALLVSGNLPPQARPPGPCPCLCIVMIMNVRACRATSSSDTQADVGDVKLCGAEHDGKRFGDEQSAGSEQSQRSRQRTTSGSSGSHNNVQLPDCGPAGLRPQEVSHAEDHTEAVSPSHPPVAQGLHLLFPAAFLQQLS